ncbi:HbrB-like protein, partial [Aspergillus heteromorphus CBS 117.55]
DDSITSNVTTISPHQPSQPSATAFQSHTHNTQPHTNRSPVSFMPQNDILSRKPSGRGSSDLQRRSRHHSQGFFEPSLPTASSDASLSASRIAAQAAMLQQQQQQQQQQQSSAQSSPHRPPTVRGVSDDSRLARGGSASPPPPLPAPLFAPPTNSTYQNGGGGGGHTHVATTAANVVFPRAPALQPPGLEIPQEREHKHKGEKSKMKLFSKPKHIGISRDKDGIGKDRGLPSPSKMGFPGGGLSRIVSASTTSLADTFPSNNSSMYNLSNASVSTVVPSDKPGEKEKEKEKDKHKHHFLSRQKLKLKDRDDHYNLPLSSASSNSKPSDPNAPQSLYSFTPASPGAVTTTFGKSVSGLDLLHGLREKKKEEKAQAEEQVEWTASSSGPGASSGFPGPSSLGSSTGMLAEAALRETLQGFGLNNMTPEDAWDFLKAKLMVIFDGEDVRIAIEDLNKLVLIHIQRCVQKRTPTAVVDDLRELLETGCASLNHTLSGIPDEKLVPHLVQVWMLVFGTILPFIQAVFLPLDLEFKGCGSVMNRREASEFWASALHGEFPGCDLDVRNLVLIAFRDMVILYRYDILKATFSRLSLDSIKLGTSLSVTTKSSAPSNRPTTSASLDGGFGSYSSQSSTLLNTAASASLSSESLSGHNRSRAASNTSSNPDQLIFQSFSSPPQRPSIIHRSSHTADTSHIITETVGRMLQCVSVLASIELLSKELKHNWLGRGRTGRDRRGADSFRSKLTVV